MNPIEENAFSRRHFLGLTATASMAALTSSGHAEKLPNVLSGSAPIFVGPTLNIGIRPPEHQSSGVWVNSVAQFAEEISAARATGIGAFMVNVSTSGTRDTALRNLLRLGTLTPSVAGAVSVPLHSTVTAALAEGRIAVLPYLRNAQIFGTNLADLTDLRTAGVGVMGLAYDWKGPYGDGALERSDQSLTTLGVKAVRRMNAERIVIDLSHLGRKGSLEAIRVSSQPVIFSHANAAAVQPHPANLTDEQIRACATTGGVIGVAVPQAPTAGGPKTAIDQLMRHLDYLIDLVGIDHVGLGQVEVASLRQELLARGLSDREFAQLCGGNFRRVFERIWSS